MILELFATKFKFFYNLIMKWRKELWSEEIKMAKISEKNKVFYIGSGILPTGPILITEITKAKIVGIDNSKKAVKISGKFIKKKGLES